MALRRGQDHEQVSGSTKCKVIGNGEPSSATEEEAHKSPGIESIPRHA